MIRLTGSEGVDQAVNMMKSLEQELTSLVSDHSKSLLSVQGLNNFGQRVVYAEVQPHHPQTLMSLVSLVKRKVQEAGPNVALNDKFGFVPHLTLAKVSRPVARLRRSKYINSGYYSSFSGSLFGDQPVDNVQLCVIDSATRYDGFYNTLVEIKI